MKKVQIKLIGLAIFLTMGGAAWGADCGDGVAVCSCGDKVVADTTLDAATDPVVFTGGADTVCPGNGLVVAGGVELDLDGNRIKGSGTGFGVIIETGANNVTIKKGIVEIFGTGIGTEDTTTGSTISQIKARRNTDTGISVVGSNNILDLNRLEFNSESGILVYGDENRLIRNQVICTKKFGCESDGIKVSGDKNTLDRNLSDRNGGDGVSVNGSGNTLMRNRAQFNVQNGVFATGGGNKDAGGNRGKGNGGVQCEIDGTPCRP